MNAIAWIIHCESIFSLTQDQAKCAKGNELISKEKYYFDKLVVSSDARELGDKLQRDVSR